MTHSTTAFLILHILIRQLPFEIARSIQAKNKEIKSGDLVRLLNENGFDVKGANSNIEDKEIAFLLQTFNDPKKVEKILASHNTEEVKEEKKSEKKEPVKELRVKRETLYQSHFQEYPCQI